MKALWFSEANKYNGPPLADLTMVESMTRWRLSVLGEPSRFVYYSNLAEAGIGAAVGISQSVEQRRLIAHR